jgi:ER-bound oxygenase mpaB/B'/Rubber oxygenase, catalytic domain
MSIKLWLGTPDRYARLRRIEALDLKASYREITALFYGDFQSVMLPKSCSGLMFTFSAPRISRVLSSTGEVEHRIAKRVVDTTLLASAVMEHGFGTGIGADAARRVSAMHRHYDIHEDDFVATACEEALVSLELAEKFGWRRVTDKEREALRIFYNRQARVFGSPKPLPESIPLMRQFFSGYLDTQLRFEPQNLRLAKALISWFCGLAPRPLRPLFPTFLLANVDARIVRACGLRVPSKISSWAAHAAMKIVGMRDPLPDNAPNGLEELARSIYPSGWQVNELGTHLENRVLVDQQPQREPPIVTERQIR